MFDVIAFLIENFQDLDDCPPRDDLDEFLAEAGFEGEEIRDALRCLDDLTKQPLFASEQLLFSHNIRIYCPEEQQALSGEVLGLLHFLEQEAAINPLQRELIVHALLHLHSDDVTVENTKLLALMVLWLHKSELPMLIGDDLLTALHGESTLQ